MCSIMQIGPHQIFPPLVLAPMAGTTDLPFRQLCRRWGAGMAVSEMVHSDISLWHTRKSRLRLDQSGELAPRNLQIAGYDPKMMAEAARVAADRGAQIIDINMGCPVKKVTRRLAGSALLGDERLVGEILSAVVDAVSLPVTLKIRLGLDKEHVNALRIAQIAEQSGVQALTIHGRTRACRFSGTVDYDAIARVKAQTRMPVIANGDICSADDAKRVLAITGADGLMIGRGAQGKPWVFAEIAAKLGWAKPTEIPQGDARLHLILEHIQAMHGFYGESLGVRTARKHLSWYLQDLSIADQDRQRIMAAETALDQCQAVELGLSGFYRDTGLAA